MSKENMLKMSMKFDESNYKLGALETFVEMYSSYINGRYIYDELKNISNKEQMFKDQVQYITNYYCDAGLKNCKDELLRIREFESCKYMLYMIIELYDRGYIKDVKCIKSYTDISLLLNQYNLYDLYNEYTNKGIYASSQKKDMLEHNNNTLSKVSFVESWNLENIYEELQILEISEILKDKIDSREDVKMIKDLFCTLNIDKKTDLENCIKKIKRLEKVNSENDIEELQKRLEEAAGFLNQSDDNNKEKADSYNQYLQIIYYFKKLDKIDTLNETRKNLELIMEILDGWEIEKVDYFIKVLDKTLVLLDSGNSISIGNARDIDVKNGDDLLRKTTGLLLYAYNMIIKMPGKKAIVYDRICDYVEVVNEVTVGKYPGKWMNDSLLYSVIYSPESIFTIMNYYCMSKKEIKEKAKLLLLQLSYSQFQFIFNKRVVMYDDISENDCIKNLIGSLDGLLCAMEATQKDYCIIPSFPFYNIHFFSTRIGKNVVEEAKLIDAIDQLDNRNIIHMSFGVEYDYFVDEVMASVKNSIINNGEPLITALDDDVYRRINELGINNQSHNVKRFVQKYKHLKNEYYEHIGNVLEYYLLGIYLRTLYCLADSIEDNEGNFPFALYRDRALNILFNKNIYGKANTTFLEFGKEKRENAKLHAYSEIQNQIMNTLNQALDNLTTYEQLINMNPKRLFAKYSLWLGSDDWFLKKIDEQCEMISNKLEFLTSSEKQYIDKVQNITNKYEIIINNYEKMIKIYLQDNFEQIKDEIKISGAISSLSTGEFLYNQYIEKKDLLQMDYSYIAIEYYKAIEYILNFIFYIPYRQKVLKPICDKINVENIDEDLKGYIGTSKAAYILDKNNQPKSRLELGTLSNMYINLFKKNGTVSKKSEHIAEYLDEISLDKTKVHDLFKDIVNVAKLRNEAAHGGESMPVEKAKKAQDITYFHFPNPDPSINVDKKDMAVECHNLIEQIFNLIPTIDVNEVPVTCDDYIDEILDLI